MFHLLVVVAGEEDIEPYDLGLWADSYQDCFPSRDWIFVNL